MSANGRNEEWISVVGWRRFQHYDPSKRRPAWIKLYLDLLQKDEYLELSEHRALLIHRLWITYAASGCRLLLDTASISRRTGLRVTRADIEALCNAGFLAIVASSALAEGYQDASPRERDIDISLLKEGTPRVRARRGELQDLGLEKGSGKGEGWVDDLSSYTGCRLVRGTHGSAYVFDVLGRDKPPADWAHGKPTREAVATALRMRG